MSWPMLLIGLSYLLVGFCGLVIGSALGEEEGYREGYERGLREGAHDPARLWDRELWRR